MNINVRKMPECWDGVEVNHILLLDAKKLHNEMQGQKYAGPMIS